jgi:hypothetical protein
MRYEARGIGAGNVLAHRHGRLAALVPVAGADPFVHISSAIEIFSIAQLRPSTLS